MWKSLSGSSEQIPPLYFLTIRIVDQWFRHAGIGMRAPSAPGLGAGLLVTAEKRIYWVEHV